MEAPAQIGAGVGDPVVTQPRNLLLRAQGLRSVLRVLVHHPLQHGVLLDQFRLSQAHQIRPAISWLQALEPGEIVTDQDLVRPGIAAGEPVVP